MTPKQSVEPDFRQHKTTHKLLHNNELRRIDHRIQNFLSES